MISRGLNPGFFIARALLGTVLLTRRSHCHWDDRQPPGSGVVGARTSREHGQDEAGSSLISRPVARPHPHPCLEEPVRPAAGSGSSSACLPTQQLCSSDADSSDDAGRSISLGGDVEIFSFLFLFFGNQSDKTPCALIFCQNFSAPILDRRQTLLNTCCGQICNDGCLLIVANFALLSPVLIFSQSFMELIGI